MGIYFVSNGEFVKIGYTSRSAESRIRALQTGNHTPLQLLAFNDQWGKDKETELHSKFAKFRQGGEWFALADELRFFIESINPKAFGKTRAKSMRANQLAMPSTPEANDNSTEACFNWYRRLWDECNSAKLFRILHCNEKFLDDAKEQQKWINDAIELGYDEIRWRIPGESDVYPEMYLETNGIAFLLIDALASIHGINMSKHRYASSAELYPLFRRYFEATFYNDRNWKAYSKYVKECRGEESVNQRSDTFWCFVDCVVAWSWLNNDQPIVNLQGFSDKVKFFCAIMPTPYRVKHIVEKDVGFYCHRDDSIAGFMKFCDFYGFEPIYDSEERTVSIKQQKDAA
jgi:hypothetical protein